MIELHYAFFFCFIFISFFKNVSWVKSYIWMMIL